MNLENISSIEARLLVNLEENSFNNQNWSSSYRTKKGNFVSYSPVYQVVPPNQKAEILITLECKEEEIINDILEILVENGESQCVRLRANV